MALPKQEPFTGTAGDLTSGYTQMSAATSVGRDGSGHGTASVAGDAFAFDNVNTYDPAQYSQELVVSTSGGSPEPIVRASGTEGAATRSCYFAYFSGGAIGIGKFVNNGFTDKGSVAGSWAASDLARIETDATNGITLKKSGATVTTATDSSLPSGAAGPGIDNTTAILIGAWEGGNVTAAAVISVPPFSRGPWRRRRSKAAALGPHGPRVRSPLRGAFVVAAAGSVVLVTGASEGDSASNLVLNAVRLIAGATAGSGTSGLTLNAVRKITGLSTGSSASAAILTAVRQIIGATSGTSADAVKLNGVRLLAGATTGSSADSATLEVVRLIIGATSGTSASALALTAVRILLGATSGTSVSNAALVSSTAPIGGVTTGQGASDAILVAVRLIIGATAGSSSDSASIGGVTRIVAGSTSGVSFSDAVIAPAGAAPPPTTGGGGGGFGFRSRSGRAAQRRAQEREPRVLVIGGHTSGTSRSSCELLVVSPVAEPVAAVLSRELVAVGGGEWTDDDVAALFALMAADV